MLTKIKITNLQKIMNKIIIELILIILIFNFFYIYFKFFIEN